MPGRELFVKNIGICRILRFPLFLSLHRQTVPLCICEASPFEIGLMPPPVDLFHFHHRKENWTLSYRIQILPSSSVFDEFSRHCFQSISSHCCLISSQSCLLSTSRSLIADIKSITQLYMCANAMYLSCNAHTFLNHSSHFISLPHQRLLLLCTRIVLWVISSNTCLRSIFFFLQTIQASTLHHSQSRKVPVRG